MDKTSVMLFIGQHLVTKAGDYQRMLNDISEGIAGETKSSAGDKYETSRAMAQMEADQLRGQLGEILRQISLLQSLSQEETTTIQAGSLVTIENDLFFIGFPGGIIELPEGKVICISPASPAAISMRGKQAGEKVKIGSRDCVISGVY